MNMLNNQNESEICEKWPFILILYDLAICSLSRRNDSTKTSILWNITYGPHFNMDIIFWSNDVTFHVFQRCSYLLLITSRLPPLTKASLQIAPYFRESYACLCMDIVSIDTSRKKYGSKTISYFNNYFRKEYEICSVSTEKKVFEC